MKKLIALFLFVLTVSFPKNILAEVGDFSALMYEISASSVNPAINDIEISAQKIDMLGNLNEISNKTINFKSSYSSGTLIDGGNQYGGFSAVNGSVLNFTNVNFQNAKAVLGGAFSAKEKSTLSFLKPVFFASNTATENGGAFYAEGSSVYFEDDVKFTDNASLYTGGAFGAEAGSNIAFLGKTEFLNNFSENNGGGFYLNRSTVTFSSEAVFDNNSSSDNGGGFYAVRNANVVFDDTASFKNNSAKNAGGAISASNSSKLEFKGAVIFSSNTAGEGGALQVSAAEVDFEKNTEFTGNNATVYGGAISANKEAVMMFLGETSFNSNVSERGGAIYALGDGTTFNFSGETVFDSNKADDFAGGIYAGTGTFFSFSDKAVFKNNIARNGGGLAAEKNSTSIFFGPLVFDSNEASLNGGGFYLSEAVLFSVSGAEFTNNKANYNGGGFYADKGSNISFSAKTVFKDNASETNVGGGFYAYRSTINFSEAEFERNISSDSGGGFYSLRSDISFLDSVSFINNYAKNSGGGADVAGDSTANFFGKVLFSSNTAGDGGALRVTSSVVNFNGDSEFTNNSATVYGGAISADFSSETNFLGVSSFTNNSAQFGGAIFLRSSEMTLSDSVFDGNYAQNAGGAVYLSGTSSQKANLIVNTSSETIFKNNKVSDYSNALFLGDYSRANFNTALGAGVYMYDGIFGNANDSVLEISGEGDFNFYGLLNNVDILLSGNGGGKFNLMSAGLIDAKNITVENGMILNTVNSAVDTINTEALTIEGTLSTEISKRRGADKIISSGTVTLGASSELEVTTDFENTDFRKRTYMLINTPKNINGVFSTVNVTTPSFSSAPAVNYGNLFKDWITITFLGDKSSTTLSSLDGLSFNQDQVSETYDILSSSSTGDLDGVISLIEAMDENGQKKALAQASGYFLANVIRSGGVDVENNEIYDRIKNHCVYGQTENGIWAQLRGSAVTYSSNRNSLNDYKDSSSGVMLGFDRFMADDNIMLGVYARYNEHDIEQGKNSADITNAGLGFYGGFMEDIWEVKALISASYDTYSTKRVIPFLDRSSEAEFDGKTFGTDIEGAMKFDLDTDMKFRPYIGLEAKTSLYDGFKEKGAQSLSLKVSGDSYTRSAARLGAGIAFDNNLFSWYFNTEGKYLISGREPEIEAVFDGTDRVFRSRGAKEGNVIFGAGIGGAIRITKQMKVFINGNYYGADKYQNLYANVGLRWNFCSSHKESDSEKRKKEKVKDNMFSLNTVDIEEVKETDAVIVYEETPPVQEDDGVDAAALLLSQDNLPAQEEKAQVVPVTEEPLAKEQKNEEINMDDESVVEYQKQEAALRRSKPVLKSFSLNMANFDTGKSKLNEKAKENIKAQAEEIKQFSFTKITIEGHTDSTGSDAINKRLSKERAKAVFDAFVECGIPAEKMSYIGFSSLLPIASNGTIEGRAQNRRVEIFVE